MLRLATVQSTTGVFALQGARAYQSARSGLEWGAAQAESITAGSGGTCNGTFTLDGFSVTVSCTTQVITEGPDVYDVYNLVSVATFSSYGNPEYVQRRLEARVNFP
jgi:MSHA biogenesis protein MshP